LNKKRTGINFHHGGFVPHQMWFIPSCLVYNIDKLAQKGFADADKQDQQ